MRARARSNAKPRKHTGPTAGVRQLVLARDGACLTCGTTIGLVVNHRKTGMGGRRPQTPEWLTTACWADNERYENVAQAVAYVAGWKLRNGLDPCRTPVRDRDGHQWLLRPDGTRELLPTMSDYIPEEQLRRKVWP